MKKSLAVTFLVLALMHCGASAPRQKDVRAAAGNLEKSENSKASITPSGFAADQILRFFGRKTGKELMAEKKGKDQKGVSESSRAVNYSASPKAPGIDNLAVVPPPPVPRVAVPRIRQEIQKIFELNKQIRNVQGGRSELLQHVQEQARIHQEVLNDIESSKEAGKDQKMPKRGDLVAQ